MHYINKQHLADHRPRPPEHARLIGRDTARGVVPTGARMPAAQRSHFILAPSSSSVHALSPAIFCRIILNGTQTVPLQHSHPIQGYPSASSWEMVRLLLRIVVGRFYAGEANGLIATQTRRFIDRARINALEKSVAFWAYDEESACLRQPIQPRKIEEPAIHDGEAAGLRRHQVEYVHFVHFTVRNVDK